MDIVIPPSDKLLDFLRTTPISGLTYEQRCALKDQRPTPKLSVKVVNKKQLRSFQFSWYDRFKWLSGCNRKNKLFCYICLMFGKKDTEWCKDGVSDLKNFIKKACTHQSSKSHLLHHELFHLLGKNRIEHVLSEAARLQAQKHNEKVTANRQVLGRIIQVVIFLAKQELAFRGHVENEDSENRENYLELLNLLAQNETLIREHLQSHSSFKGISPDIQNELIDVISYVLNEKAKSEIAKCEFISVQADETLDVSCKSQMSIILRYCVEERVEERFIGFYDVSKDKTGVGLAEIILQALKDWGVENKLISQTYDGASVMAGKEGGVQIQNLIKKHCPRALFIHCYAHQLNLVLLHGSKTIKSVKLFICSLTAFHRFFNKSSKRSVLLSERGFKLPSCSPTRWNFHSRGVETIQKHFANLHQVFESIVIDENSEWDSDTINSAVGLLKNLDDPNFVYFLNVYSSCFIFIDPLFKVLQSSTVSISTCHCEIIQAIENLESLRASDTFIAACFEKSWELNERVTFSERNKNHLRAVTYEILDSLIVQMKSRFEDFPRLRFVDLVNERSFNNYKTSFPKMQLTELIKQYPFFNEEQLENELCNVFADQRKHLSPTNLLEYLVLNGLDSVYVEVTKLLRLVLTIPVTSASSERSMSTLKRIKTFLRNTMKNHRLSSLSTLAIEKKLLGELSSDPKFIERCIDVFAEKRNRRMELIYKIV